jgi:hypothetical protein
VYPHGDSDERTHLLSIEASEEREFVALTTALNQVLPPGRGDACVLTFLGLGQRATGSARPALTFTDL